MAGMDPAGGIPAAAFATLLSGYAVRRGSLTTRGGLAAWAVGWVTWRAGSWHVAVLLAFFFGSTRVTKVGKATKAAREEGYGAGGGRDEWQVLANGSVGVVLAGLYKYYTADPAYLVGYLVHYAVVAGDTWASEIGILSDARPRLVLGFREVPHGTNGGVTALGTLGSLVGGLSVGAIAAAVPLEPAREASPLTAALLTPLGRLCLACASGVAGSVLDSVIGQFLEYSAWDAASGHVTNDTARAGAQRISGASLLNNNQVNFLTSAATAAAAVWAASS